ncbi:hypothetical protein [Mycobacterium sp.]|uniref:hypothetical protein n=1 Tax=Mycobacterium sp. TaxID=1785 RepID=UPI003D113E5F
MITRIANRDGAMTRIAPHATGHVRATDGTLVRVDYERGIGWVATHYDPSLRVIRQVTGSQEDVHGVVACWARGQDKP